VHGQVCYLQMPAVDATRAAAFYEAVFGWQTEHPYQDFESPRPDRPVGGNPPSRPTLATILDPKGNPIGLASHSTPEDLSSWRNAPGHAVFPIPGCTVML
jgi:catechol 2,3-dioxygenase-like lactoylglutathione lyase family enzyme